MLENELKMLDNKLFNKEPQEPEINNNFKITQSFWTRLLDEKTVHSLTAWAHLYFQAFAQNATPKTRIAKQRDLEKFLNFFLSTVKNNHPDAWTSELTENFQNKLLTDVSPLTEKPYQKETIRRIMSTIHHFGAWLHKQRPLQKGNPFDTFRMISAEPKPDAGLTKKQIALLQTACEKRLINCQRKDQQPLMEITVFYILLCTGLRESELVSLNIHQYYDKALHQIVRSRNHQITPKIPLPSEARTWLDQYLATRLYTFEEPLLISRYQRRLAVQDVHRICKRLAKEACRDLDPTEQFDVTPYQLRHSFLKQITEKYGLAVAQQLSGNVSHREVLRYSQSNLGIIDLAPENLFD